MLTKEVVTTLNDLCDIGDSLCNIAKTAKRNSKSLSGQGFYADKFHKEVIRARKLAAKATAGFSGDEAGVLLAAFNASLSLLTSASTPLTRRIAACRDMRTECQTTLIPLLQSRGASPIALSEQVLPAAVVESTRTYLESIIRQANGCYEHQWYDACAVLIRKFVEILIIETFEHNGRAAEIKDRNGDFLMLRDLVDKMVAESSWNLGRETKSVLPQIKRMGDRSAHNRRYLAKKHDLDSILPGLRVIADELLHLARLK